MSKFFYDGKANNNNERGTKTMGRVQSARLGTKKAPAKISVKSDERKQELQAIFTENKWVAEIDVDAEKAENIADLEFLQSQLAQNNTGRAVSTKKASRNDPCPCESGKKYKKCCGA